MFGFGMPELIIIMVIALLIFGAGKLPEVGGAIGKGIRNFKRCFHQAEESEVALKEDREKQIPGKSQGL